MPEILDNDQINRLWQHSLYITENLNNRLNVFLVLESVLLGVVGVLFTRTPVKFILLTIICLGLILTILLAYVSARQKYIYDRLKARSRELIPEYRETLLDREQVKWPISSTSVLAYGIPIVVSLVWIILLFYTIVS